MLCTVHVNKVNIDILPPTAVCIKSEQLCHTIFTTNVVVEKLNSASGIGLVREANIRQIKDFCEITS